MTHLVSAAVASPIGVAVAVVTRLCRRRPTVSHIAGRVNRTNLRGSEENPTYDSGNRRQHDKTNEHVAHARKPSTLVLPYSEKVS